MKNFDKIIKTLGINESGEIWRPDWELSESSFIPDKLFFLEPEFITSSCDKLEMKEKTKQDLLKTLRMFKNNIPLQRLAWHCHFLIFKHSEEQSENSKKWPEIPKHISDTADLFYAIVCLSGVPHISKISRDRKISQSIFIDTMSVFEPIVVRRKLARIMWWLIYHFKGYIYKLGRLQYHIKYWRHDFHVFRHKKDRKVIMFCGDNLRFRTDGQFDGSNEIFDKNVWTSKFKIEDNFIVGNPVSPYGYALPDTMKLPVSEWEEVLKKGDPTLFFHIPPASPLTHSECGKSFRQAIEFFPKHFPDHPYKAFICTSWILDYQLEKYLPPTSNLIQFMQELYLHPVSDTNDSGLFGFVFGRKFDDLSKIPQETTLHRVIVQHMKSGGRWRNEGCVFLPEDLNWGNKVYRTSFILNPHP